MKKRTKQVSGITLIALVITIIILLILAGVSIAMLTGQNGLLTKANAAKGQTQEQSAKEKIQLAIMGSVDEDGKLNVEDFKKEIERLGGTVIDQTEETITVEMDGYEAVIDIKTGKILSFESSKGVRPELDIKQELSTDKTTVTITVTVTNEVDKVDTMVITNLDTGETLAGNVNGKTGTFTTTLNGFYKVEVKATTDGGQKTKIQTIEVQIPVEFSMGYGRVEVVWLDTSDKIIPTPNEPDLMGMTRVKWEGTAEQNPTSNNGWYEYKAKTGKDDNNESYWANAKMTKNGVDSYFVWIPRYAYRITYYANKDSNQITGYCDGKGIREVNGNVKQALPSTAKTVEKDGKSYIVHPAFRDGTANKWKNGEWDSELSGIWVAKYESSKNDATDSSAGSGTNIKIVPNVQSWRNITIGDCYTTAKSYDTGKESHLMKNSEWGAVAYLTQSQYGRNGHEIDINNSSSYITGNGGGSPNASSSGTTYAYNTEQGMKASTTGNIYGIYDLSGGAYERVAGYISNGKSSLSQGSSFANTTANPDGYKTLSSKYATVYPYDNINDGASNNYTVYKNAEYGYGDSILETSRRGGGTFTSWFEEQSYFPNTSYPFFIRGGNYSEAASAGAFYFTNTGFNENGNIFSFRVVLAGA